MNKNLFPMGRLRPRSTLAAFLLLALVAGSVQAVTFYPTDDTYSTLTYSAGKNPIVTRRYLTNAGGVSGSLFVSRSHSAFIQFNAAAQLQGATVTSAKLTIYFPSAAKPGALDLRLVTGSVPWTETFKGSSFAEPPYKAPFYTIPLAGVAAKRFVVIDVTPEVQGWLSGTPDYGFAIVSPDGVANLLIGAKEGPGSGYPATLEVDTADAAGSLTGMITSAEIAAGAVTSTQLAAGAVGSTDLASNLTLPGTTTGTFSGNGAGLTNIPATAVAAPPPGMALIPAGAFTMGDSQDNVSSAIPTVSVTVSAFYMDVNLVSLSQWQSVYYWATANGYAFDHTGSGKGANHPVQTVSWHDCVKWCNARSEHAGKPPVYYLDAGFSQVYRTGVVDAVFPNWAAAGYRLPTEAEWEKASRGGLSGQRFPWGNTITENLANYYGDATDFNYDLGPNGYNAIGSTGGTDPGTSPVGSFAANGYGLCDMAGNVEAWCWDWFGTSANGGDDYGGTDPRGSASGPGRVTRGGNWAFDVGAVTCAGRSVAFQTYSSNYIGFRAVLAPGP